VSPNIDWNEVIEEASVGALEDIDGEFFEAHLEIMRLEELAHDGENEETQS
jgi:hypothetical protein